MPEIPAAERGRGAWVAPNVRPRRRLYGPEDAGPPCPRCRTPIVHQLAKHGIRIHPSCAPVE